MSPNFVRRTLGGVWDMGSSKKKKERTVLAKAVLQTSTSNVMLASRCCVKRPARSMAERNNSCRSEVAAVGLVLFKTFKKESISSGTTMWSWSVAVGGGSEARARR